jgi:hypothetical protein
MRQPVSEHSTCPSCHTGLREFIINENYLVCPCCETLFRKWDESISPKEDCVKESYRERAITILNSDKMHYENLYCNPFIVEKFRIPLLNRDWILSIGGGHPKLESYLNPARIEICDLFPQVYLETIDEFRRLYNYYGDIHYHPVKIDAAFTFPAPADTNKGLITFVHFLEHLEYDQAVQVLENLPRQTDVAIYGPNSEKKPMDCDWIHMRPKDHLTLIPLKRLREILSAMKYEIRYDTPYSDDLLILFSTG